jgi:curli biogenesis system outer membrane secretion channel CsgG
MLFAGWFGCAGQKKVVEDSEATLTGTYVSKPFDGLRKKVAVTNFINATRFGQRRLGDEISVVLISELSKSGRFVLLERENLQDILEQVALSQTGLTEGTLEQIRLLDADYIITGKVTHYAVKTTGSSGIFTQSKTQRAEVGVDVRLIDVRSGEILLSETGNGASEKTFEKVLGHGESGGYDESLEQYAFRKAVIQLTEKLIGKLDSYPWRCDVVQVEKDALYINAGSRSNLKIGDRLAIYKPGKEIKDLNGNIIGYEEIYITDTAVIRLVGEKSAALQVNPGDNLQLPLFCKSTVQ